MTAIALIHSKFESLAIREIEKLKAAVSKSNSNIKHQTIYKTTLLLDDFENLLSPSLFSEPSFVILKSFDEFSSAYKEMLPKLINDADPNIYLAITYSNTNNIKGVLNALKKTENAKIKEIKVPEIKYEKDVISLINTLVDEKNKKIEFDANKYIKDTFNLEIDSIVQFVSQLSNDIDAQMIKLSDVIVYFENRFSINIFALVDDILKGNVKEALITLNKGIKNGISAHQIRGLISKKVYDISQMHLSKSGYKLPTVQKMNPWVLKQNQQFLPIWNQEKFKKYIIADFNLSKNLVTNSKNELYLMEQFILDIS